MEGWPIPNQASCEIEEPEFQAFREPRKPKNENKKKNDDDAWVGAPGGLLAGETEALQHRLGPELGLLARRTVVIPGKQKQTRSKPEETRGKPEGGSGALVLLGSEAPTRRHACKNGFLLVLIGFPLVSLWFLSGFPLVSLWFTLVSFCKYPPGGPNCILFEEGYSALSEMLANQQRLDTVPFRQRNTSTEIITCWMY